MKNNSFNWIRRVVAQLGLAVLLCVQSAGSAFGFVFLNDPPASGYVMNLDLGTAPITTTSYGVTTWNALAQNALAAWNQVGVGPQQDHNFFTLKTPAVVGNACTQDGISEVTFSTTLCGLGFGSALAVTQSRTLNGLRVEEDVIFDGARTWGAYVGPYQFTQVDFYRVALHEFGHVVGLDHPDEWGQVKTSLMNSIIGNLYAIQQDDIDGAHLVNWYWFTFPTQYGVAVNSVQTSAPITVTGISAPTPISVTGGQYSINGAAYTSAPGTVSNGQTVTLQLASSSAPMTATTATLNIGAASADFSVITANSATPMSLNALTLNPLVDGVVTSYQKNGVNGYTDTVLPGTTTFNAQTVKAVLNSEGRTSYSTSDANGVRSYGMYDPAFFLLGFGKIPRTATFTPPLLSAPATMALGQVVTSSGTLNDALPAAALNTSLTYSNTATVEALETITVPAGTFNTVRVRSALILSGTANGNAIKQSITDTSWYANGVGMVKGLGLSSDVNTYLLTGASNLVLDAIPDPFSFVAQTAAQPATWTLSAPITISGINTPSAISIVGGEYSVNGLAYTAAAGTVNNGDVVTVRVMAAAGYASTLSATLSIGGVSAAFSATTVTLDTVPNAFGFVPQINVPLASSVVSAPVTISGINTPTPISIVGGEYSVNGGAFTTLAGTVNNGDVVTVRQVSYGLYNATHRATLSVGGVTATFSATTHNNPSGTVVRVQTSLGAIDIALFDTATPLSVANFMAYVNSGAYINSFIHRSVPGFVIQGGGYTWNSTSNQYLAVTAKPPVLNEFSATRSNLRGTLAMAKLAGNPNSATSEWFINLADNSANLDAQNGGFTVFAQVVGGMSVVDAIAALPVVNGGGALATLPLASTPAGGVVQQANLVMVSGISVLPAATTVSSGTGWNLLGNATDAPLNVAATFNDANLVTTVWKWQPTTSRWAFYTPAMTPSALASYAAGKGYDLLTTINGGEGFWVNAKQAFSFNLPAGNLRTAASFQGALNLGWNLVAMGETKTPSQFNSALSVVAPAAGVVPINLTTLWAWDGSLANWYFYAPALEANATLSNYIASKGYLDFAANGKSLGAGVGFWANRP